MGSKIKIDLEKYDAKTITVEKRNILDSGSSSWTLTAKKMSRAVFAHFFHGLGNFPSSPFSVGGDGNGSRGVAMGNGRKMGDIFENWMGTFYNGCNVGILRCNYRLSNGRFGCEQFLW